MWGKGNWHDRLFQRQKEQSAARRTFRLSWDSAPFSVSSDGRPDFFRERGTKKSGACRGGIKKARQAAPQIFSGQSPPPESKGSCPEPFSDKPRSRAFFQVLSRSRFEAGNSASCRIRLSAIFFISGVSFRFFFITYEEVSFRGGVKASSSKAA